MRGFWKQHIRSYITDTSGAILPIAAILFPIIIGMVALGVDAGSWLITKRNLQNAADAAVLAAAWELARGDVNSYDFAAEKEATNNGFDPNVSGNGMQVTVDDINDPGIVTVTLSQNARLFFSSLFTRDIDITAQSVADLNRPTHEFCVLGLEQVEGSTVEVIGNVTVNSPNCGIAVNSEADDALYLKGSVDITIGTVQITGDYVEQGNTSFWYDNLKTNAPRTDDPYEDWEIDEYKGDCNGDESPQHISASGTVVVSPGTYCGGLKISGTNDVIFEPGVYVMDGGDFDVSGGGTLNGDGVSFVFTSSTEDNYGNLNVSGNKYVTFSAPPEGDEMEGVVFFQDRDAPPDNENKIVGTSTIDIDGAAYFPSQQLRFGGNSGLLDTGGCVKLIARIVSFHGNPSLTNNCEGNSPLPIGNLFVNLIQ